MKKNIWIWNHYATNMLFDQAGRHYWFAENLLKQGYEPTVFCANTFHNSDKIVNTHGKKYVEKKSGEIPFVFINVPKYSGNGVSRIRNMLAFYKNLFPVSKQYAKEYGKPDVILASSVHPLTMVAGIKIAKKFNVPCICEVRDLWPETLVQFGKLRRNGPIAKILYLFEKKIYDKADRIIFTMEGGCEYIKDRGWNYENGGPIDLDKVEHINNGIDLDKFNFNKIKYVYEDKDLKDSSFKVLYTGSMGQANALKNLLDCAQILKEKNHDDIIFFLFGDGQATNELKQYAEENELNNVLFKGRVERKYIPYILSKGKLNIMTGHPISLYKYGLSLNKMFDYFASGKPILSALPAGYDLIERYNIGISLKDQTPQNIANAILKIKNMDRTEYEKLCDNAKLAAEDYDFKVLTEELIDIFKDLQTVCSTKEK